jgi:hypothetical protein
MSLECIRCKVTSRYARVSYAGYSFYLQMTGISFRNLAYLICYDRVLKDGVRFLRRARNNA